LRAKGFYCSFDTGNWQNEEDKISAVFFVINTLDLDPDSLEMPDPDSINPDPQHAHTCAGDPDTDSGVLLYTAPDPGLL
jgi:hypothetical protein